MSPRTSISLALLALALLTGLLMMRQRSQSGREEAEHSSDSSPTHATPVATPSSPSARQALTAISPSGGWSPDLDDVDMFNGNLECPEAIYDQGFAPDEVDRFKTLLAEFRAKIIGFEKEVAEVIEGEEGVSLRIVTNEESTRIAEWFAGQLSEFESREKLGAKYFASGTYIDLTNAVRTISMEVGKASEWGDEPLVINVSRQTKDSSGSRRTSSRVEFSDPFEQEASRRYRHVIDIPATGELLRAEAKEGADE